MIWPPVKAWTSKLYIDGQVHFVAINYGGVLLKRWVVLMSVLDSTVVVKVSWSQLVNSSDWESGWDERNHIGSSEMIRNESVEKTADLNLLDLSIINVMKTPLNYLIHLLILA